ncbi:MAG TPA: sigma-70 family RNA polymerase sigma factor [Acidimicrobiales bacterium]|nr:sigma-70 family RNA polymerase sigma factor [Acidimicrobiales bacterium]
MEGQEDGLLAARMAAGDEEALAEAFERFGALVYGLARRVTGDSSVAEDVVQEVFVALWKRPDRFDPERGSLRAYLGVQAHRRAVDAVRRDTRRSQREVRQFDGGSCAGHGDPLDAAMVTEVVKEAIGRLPAEQRRVVELTYYGGRSNREVASFLGIPEGTVKSRLRLAQSKLGTLLDRQLLEPA